MNSIEILKQVLGETLCSKMDEPTFEYLVAILEQDDGEEEEEELIDLMVSILQGITGEKEEIIMNFSKEIIKKKKQLQEDIFQDNGNINKNLLKTPIMIAKISSKQEIEVKNQLKSTLKAELNYNKTMNSIIPSSENMESVEELQTNLRKLKKELRKEKKETRREQKWALERDEIIKKLNNKPIKIHEKFNNHQIRQKDIKLEHISMTLGSLELLINVSIVFVFGKKYGLIGRNGIGKTTFLKHLAAHAFSGIPSNLQILHIEQEVEVSDDSVLHTILATDIEREALLEESSIIQKFLEIEEQQNNNNQNNHLNKLDNEEFEEIKKMTPNERNLRLKEIFDRLQEIDSDSAFSKASSILAGLGFTPEMQKQPTKQFSGGWRMRIALAQALFIEPDILLLDEPTNHLDLHAVLWLEEYLNHWNKTLIVVSHDRDFLNSVVTEIIHLNNKTLTLYKGNYDSFEKQRLESLKILERQKENQEKEIKHIQSFIDKNRVRAATAKMAQSRIKKLEKMEILPDIVKDPTFQFSFPEPDPLSEFLVQFVDVCFGYSNDKILYSEINCGIDMESKIALVGPNGVGKSTLLKLILGELQPTSGLIKINPKAKIARFSQHHVDQLDLQKTPLEWFKSMYPNTKSQDIRKHLGYMGITGNLQLQPIYSLSGGQKSRVAFAHITWIKPHLLLLDEPTNHLDMDTMDALIRALNNFSGGILIISHDAYLISTTCEQIWICDNKKINIFNGDFEDYRKLLKNY